MKKIISICFAVSFCFSLQTSAQIPLKTLVQISRAEDQLRYDKTLENLIKSADAKIRARAALASGRIGKDAAIPALTLLLASDSQAEVRATAAFAIGEIESAKGADVILQVLKNVKESLTVHARALEAAGKIAAVITTTDKKKAEELGTAILTALDDEGTKQQPDKQTILLGITAILRAKPENGEFIAAKFLTNADARIRADAANTLSRLKAKNASEQLRAILFKDKDAIARANAARSLGAAEDASAFDLLLGTALNDEDSRVRVSAIRSLGSLKDAKAADKLLERAEMLLTDYKKSKFANPVEKNELLEIATTLGRILPNTNNEKAIKFLQEFRKLDKLSSPETEIAFARISPNKYLEIPLDENNSLWQSFSSRAQGFAEIANIDSQSGQQKAKAMQQLKDVFINYPQLYTDNGIGRATPDILRAYAKFKATDLSGFLRDQLNSKIPTFRNVNERIFIRATTAELLGEQPPIMENVEALKIAFAQSLQKDKYYNEAQLTILDALFKLDKKEAVPTLLTALDAPDYLVRKKAFELLRTKDLEKDSPQVLTMLENALAKRKDRVLPRTANGSKLGVILNTQADYVRAVSRRNATAIIATEKGTFTIEFFPEDAPLTVDNFIKLAKAKYFDGLAIHRVVPNFVVQDGDPRGDGNGSPGWEIRDEINMVPYERGAVGMALSGRDTGGSQWFVTHSPQPHLDGGYTVFGRVNAGGMKIVDNLVRGDKILNVKINEGNSPQKSAKVRKEK